MIKKVFKLAFSEIRNINLAAYIIGAASLLSMLAALLRDRLFVSYIGTGTELDIYYAAFKIPDTLFALFISIISAFVIIPFLSSKNDIEKKKFISDLITVFFVSASLTAFVVILFTPNILSFLFPSLMNSAYAQDFIFIERMLMIQFVILGLSNIFLSLVQIKSRFIAYSFIPLLYSAGSIVGIIFFYPLFHLSGLVFGVLLGALLHLVFSWLYSGFCGFDFSKINIREIKNMLTQAYPRSLSLFLQQLGFLYLVTVLTSIYSGATSKFQLAFNIQNAPFSIIAVSYSVAAFPTLSKLHEKGAGSEFVDRIAISLRYVLFWTVPIMAFMLIFRAHIVRIILGSENFSWEDTKTVSAVLAVFVLSLLFQSFNIIIARAYYAAKNTRLPLLINMIYFVMLFIFTQSILHMLEKYPELLYILAKVFKLPESKTMILVAPLSFLFSSAISSFLFYLKFRYDFMHKKRKLNAFNHSVYQIILATFISALFAKISLILLGDIALSGSLKVFLHMIYALLPALSVFVLLLYMMGNVELRETLRILNRKWRQK